MMNKEHWTKNDVEVDCGRNSVAPRPHFSLILFLLSDFSQNTLSTKGPTPSSASLTPIYRKWGHLVVLKLAQAGTLSPMKNKGEDFVMEACLWGFYGGWIFELQWVSSIVIFNSRDATKDEGEEVRRGIIH